MDYPNNYPLPLIRDIIPHLAGKKHLTSVDVHKGYNNILIRPEDRHKAAFKTNKRFFQPKVMYFGMQNCHSAAGMHVREPQGHVCGPNDGVRQTSGG